MRFHVRQQLLLLPACALLAGGAAPAFANDDPVVMETFHRDLAECMKMTGADARHDCRRDAYAARDEARKGTLIPGAKFEQNKFLRCDVHKDPAEHEYCMRRMRGEGTVSGSVEGGGLLRELTVPAN